MFNSNSNGYSLADIAAATENKTCDNSFGGGNGWWILLLFLFCFNGGWNRGGIFGGSGATGSGITDGYVLTSDFANIERKIDGVNNGLCDGFYTNAQLINGVNSNINTSTQSVLTQMNNNAINQMQDTFGLQTTMNNNTNAITGGITALSNQLASCCCNQRYDMATQFANLNYNLADQSCQTRRAIADTTRDIIDNQNANTRSILDFLTQDKIASLTAENQSLKFAASQQAQNAYLVSELGAKVPSPAYIVANPYTGGYYSGCACGCTN